MLNEDLLMCAFHLILFQRQLYQRNLFKKRRKWGVPIWVCEQPEVLAYIRRAITELRPCFMESKALEVVLCVLDYNAHAVEKWKFFFTPAPAELRASDAQLRAQLQELTRQILASTVVLPLIVGPRTFKIVVALQTETDLGWPAARDYVVAREVEAEMQAVAGDWLVLPRVSWSM